MEKIKNWFNKPAFALVCYVLAILLFGYTLFTIKNSYDYISLLVTQGNVSWSNDIKDILIYFMGNSISYLFYTFSFIFFGKVINVLKPKPVKEVEINDEIESVKEGVTINEKNEPVEEIIETNDNEDLIES